MKYSREEGKSLDRSSQRRCSAKKCVLKNFAIFTGKQLFKDLQFYEKETLTQVFFCEYCKIFKNTYFEEHLRTVASAWSISTIL